MQDWQHGGFGLYLHWPFCAAKCPYCDFNSHVAQSVDHAAWQAAYLAEIDRIGALTQGRILNTVFFGGGTPSLMQPDMVAALIERIRATWPLANDLEITLEANPSSIEAGRFRGFRAAGVNRVSMGMQAMNDADLRRLGRLHSAAEARAAFDIARAEFDRVSFDLIYARQDQSLADWRQELTAALDLAIDHLSLYQLTIEDGTAFGARHAAGGLRGLPSDDSAADMYALTQDLCAQAGMPAYEVSNHAREGAQSRHNLIYWRYGDYAGIGPGAHGRLTLNGRRHATETLRQPQAWLAASQGRPGGGETLCAPLTPEDEACEFLLMGMRLREGIDLGRLAALRQGGQAAADRGDAATDAGLDPARLADLVNLGMVTRSGDRLAATDQGRAVLNAVLRELMVE